MSASTFGMAGTNGLVAEADIDSAAAVAPIPNRFSSDFTAITRADASVAETHPPRQPEQRSLP